VSGYQAPEEPTEPDPIPSAGEFDGWYADMTTGDERLLARLRRVDLGAGLAGAGFTDIEVRERPGWRDHERAMWEDAAALDPGDDPALRSFHEEGVRSLPILDLTRRVMASAAAP
jgi:hypothetical protein